MYQIYLLHLVEFALFLMKFFWNKKDMNRFYIKSVIILIISGLLFGCKALKDGLEGNKKYKSAAEFLIEKKNTIVLPPDFTELTQSKEVAVEETKEVSKIFD